MARVTGSWSALPSDAVTRMACRFALGVLAVSESDLPTLPCTAFVAAATCRGVNLATNAGVVGGVGGCGVVVGGGVGCGWLGWLLLGRLTVDGCDALPCVPVEVRGTSVVLEMPAPVPPKV